MSIRIILSFALILLLFSCSQLDHKEKSDGVLSITLKPALSNQYLYPKIKMADSLLQQELFGKDSIQVNIKTIKDDSILSLNERIANQAKKEKFSFKKQYPLLSILSPDIERQTNGTYTLRPSGCIGFAIAEDTLQVNKYLAMENIKPLFREVEKFIWMQSTGSKLYSLFALKKNGRSITIFNSGIENIVVEESDLHNDVTFFDLGGKVEQENQCLIFIFNENTLNKLKNNSEHTSGFFASITLNNKQYISFITLVYLENGLGIPLFVNQQTLDLVKLEYGSLIKE